MAHPMGGAGGLLASPVAEQAASQEVEASAWAQVPAQLDRLLGVLVVGAWLWHSWRFQGQDPDLMWQIKYGQMIWAKPGLYEHDLFSWSAPGGHWFNPEWGGQLLTYALHQLGGMGAISGFHWLLFACTLGVALHAFREAGGGWLVSAYGAVALHALLYGQVLYRLQNFTAAFLILTMWALLPWWRTRALGVRAWALPALMLLWVNLHGGGAIAGWASVVVVVAVALAQALWTKVWQGVWPLAWLSVGMGLALCLNPHGPWLPWYSLSMLWDPTAIAVNQLAREWLPFDAANPSYRAYFGVLAVVVLASLWAKPRPPLSLVALALTWTLLAALSRRHLALAAVTLMPWAAWNVGAFALRPSRAKAWVGAGLCALSLWGLSWAPPWHRVDFQGFPPPSPAALGAILTRASDTRLLNFYEWGGFLMLHAHPQVKIFIDGRAYHYGPTGMLDYNRMMNLAPGWEQLLVRHDVQAVVAPPMIGLVNALAESPGWEEVFRDETAVLLLRKKRPGAVRLSLDARPRGASVWAMSPWGQLEKPVRMGATWMN